MNKFAYTTPWGTIKTGELFEYLPVEEQRAVIAHERGHLHHRHVWKRVKHFVRHGFTGLHELCAAQELEADSYARDTGHGEALGKFLTKHVKMTAYGYPSVIRRLENLYG